MNAPATLPHLQAVRAELRACCDAIDDADSVRGFLRNLYASLPSQAIAPTKEERPKWQCDPEDRIRMSPQYRALRIEVQVMANWALVGRLGAKVPTYASMPIADEHITAAIEFFRRCRDAVDESDDVWETAETARDELIAAIQGRERDEAALVDWRDDRREWERLGYRREA